MGAPHFVPTYIWNPRAENWCSSIPENFTGLLKAAPLNNSKKTLNLLALYLHFLVSA
jgi:hypothetical protein